MLNSIPMVDRDAPTTAGPVVICCAAADGDTIRPVVDDLEAQGHTVTLLEGIEASPASLGPAVERLRGEGLYVLCRSKALGRGAVDELRDILLAHHVPFGRTLTVASTRPRELRERIGASLRRLATGKAKRMSGVSPDGPSLRTTRLGVTPPPPTPVIQAAPKPDPPGTSRSTRVGLPPTDPAKAAPAGAAAVPPRPAKAATPPPPPAARKAVVKPPAAPSAEPVEPAEPAEPVDDFEPEAPANLTPAIEEEADALPREPSGEALIQPDDLADLDAAPPPEEPPAPARPTSPVRTGSTSVSPVIPRSTLDAIRTGDTAIVSREALLAAGLENEENPAPPPGGATLRSTASDLAGGTVRAATTALPDEDDDTTKKPPWLWIGVGAAALVLVGIIGFAVSGDDETEDDTSLAAADASKDQEGSASGAASDADTKTDTSNGENADSPAVKEDEPASDREGPTRIGHALRTRAIRGLDVLLVSNTEGPLSWEAAKEHCGALELGGLDTWRLPAVGELMSLTQAQMTQRGYYWSATPADTFGDTPLVWYAKRSRVVTRGRDNLVLCVRGGSAAG